MLSRVRIGQIAALAAILLLAAAPRAADAAFPTVGSTSSGTATATPGSGGTIFPIAYPSGAARGDLLVCMIVALSASTTFTFEGDWTQLSVRQAATFSTTSAYTVADGLNTGTQVTLSVTSTATRYICYRFTVGTFVPPPYGVLSATGLNANPDPPSLTGGGGIKDYVWLAWAAWSGTAIRLACPTSYDTPIDVTGTSPGLSVCQRQLNAATENPGTFTLSALSLWDAQTIAIEGKVATGPLPGTYDALVAVTTATESPGANCANGGTKVTITSGVDDGFPSGTAGDGVLDAGEVSATTAYYSCTGAQGPTGSQGPAGNGGLNGTNGAAGANGTNGSNGANGTNGSNGINGTDGAPGANGTDGVFWTLSDIVTLLLIAFVLLLLVGYMFELPFIYIVAGMVLLLLAVQAYNETSSPIVGMSLGSLGLVTLVGGLNEIFRG